jgi:hypothetical protein
MRIIPPALLVSLLLGGAAPAGAQADVAAFYKGKQLRMIVGSAVGGGYDLFARIVARHIVNHIPGNPHIIVQNQPAAGGVVMVNQLYGQGPKDGTVIGVPINGIPTAPLLQAGTQFDPTRLVWIGSTNREAYVAFVWHTVPVESIAELTSKEVVVGATTPGTTMVDFPLLVNDVLGTKFKVVRGYQGTPQINLAIERGEVQGMGGLGWASVKAQTPHWISERKIKVLAQYGSSVRRSWRMSRPCWNSRNRRPIGRRRRCCSRARNTAGRISCRRTCRSSASRRCGAPSMPP